MLLETIVKPRTIAVALAVISLYLTVQSIFGEFINTTVLHSQYSSIPALILDEFSVNAEQTIPTWYQVILLLFVSFLLAVIAGAKRTGKDPYTRYWIGLAVIFLYLSMDESAAIHEIFSEPLHVALHTSGFLAFGWQIAAAPLLVIVGLLFLRFLLHLPSRTRYLFIVAGVFYVGGAFAIDAISANQLPATGELTLQYLAIGTIEELFEMAGIVTFIYTLLTYIADNEYQFLFHPVLTTPKVLPSAISHVPEAVQGAGTAPSPSSTIPRFTQILRRMLPMVLFVVGINLALVYWAITQEADAIPIVTDPVPVYQAIIEGFPNDKILVTHMNGLFGSDDLAARHFAASLLDIAHNVLVITIPSSQSSTFVAGDILPFDRETLSEFLLARGEIEFIIYDTAAVKALVG